MHTKLSVLICTYNRPELLRKALEALIVATVEKPDQVVIVNGGGESSDAVVEAFYGLHGVDVQLQKTTNKNLAASRNIGLPICTGNIMAMTDDDARVFPDWVTQMKRAHCERPEAGAVGGPVLGANTDALVGKVADLVTFPAWQQPRNVRTLPGVNISYKRHVLEQIGLQDEELFRGEDVDFNWRVKQLGHEIYFDPAIKVYHDHRPTWRGLLQQHYMYGRAYYLVRRKWPEMYCVYPHHMHRWHDFLKAGNFVAALLYQPFLTIRQLPSLADRLRALPLLFALGLAWKGGMIEQAARERYKSSYPLTNQTATTDNQ